MMLAKLLICSILIFLARGTFITSQTCTTHTQCTNDGESPHTTQQDISPQQNTLIRGKAGPKGLKGEQGDRGKTGRSGRDCNEAIINTKITQVESIVKYNIEALERVTAKNEADIILSQNNIEALERVTAKNEADIILSQNECESFKTVTAKNEAELHDQVEDLKTQLNATQINLDQSNEQLQTLRDDLNESKNELSSANDKITRLEVKMQMLISATTAPEPTTTETTTTISTTPEPTTTAATTPATTAPVSTTTETTTTETTTTETILSDEDRAKACGVISTIPNSRITASSIWYNEPGWGTQHSRLFSTKGFGAWLPHYPWQGHWIQIDLETDVKIRGVATQGQHNHIYHWITSYNISFKTSTSSSFQNIQDQSGTKKIFQGNTDNENVVINDVDITARYIRIYPRTWNVQPSLRFDVLTC